MLEGCLKSFLKNWGWYWVLRIVQKSLKYSHLKVRLKNPSLKNSIHINLKILKISSKNIYVQMSLKIPGNDFKIYVSRA